MSCLSCGSSNQMEFPAEMLLHFSGLDNLHAPNVLLYPKVLVCRDCGFSQFIATKSELALLANTPALACAAVK